MRSTSAQAPKQQVLYQNQFSQIAEIIQTKIVKYRQETHLFLLNYLKSFKNKNRKAPSNSELKMKEYSNKPGVDFEDLAGTICQNQCKC
jgi:hypothetical protein